MTEQRKLYRSRDDRVIAGVCGGLGEYFGVDPVFIRLIALALLFAGGSAFIIYLVMAIVVPEKPLGESETPAATGTETASGPVPSASDSAPQSSSAYGIPTAETPAAYAVGASAEHASSTARNAGVAAGLVLIGIGLVFLLAQFMPGIAWWSLWPLIIIFVGLVECVTPGKQGWSAERFFSGLGTIAAGLVLLGNVTGYISWSVWWTLLSLWPLLLVSIGLSLLAKGLHQSWLRAMGSLVILAAFVYAASVSWVGSGGTPLPDSWTIRSSGTPYSMSAPETGVSSAKLKLEAGGASIKIDSGTVLAKLTGESPSGAPTFEVDRAGSSASVRVASDEQGPIVMGPEIIGQRMRLELGTSPVWDVDISTGAASVDADLTDLELSSVKLSSGVSAVNVKLGTPAQTGGPVPVVAKSGVGSLDLSVPAGVEARVDVDSGLTGTNLHGRFVEVGDHWETPGYSSASTSYAIRIESGIGSVAVTAN